MKTVDEALTEAMFKLRMNLAGHSSYSGSPCRIDEGWAALVQNHLSDLGYQIKAKDL